MESQVSHRSETEMISASSDASTETVCADVDQALTNPEFTAEQFSQTATNLRKRGRVADDDDNDITLQTPKLARAYSFLARWCKTSGDDNFKFEWDTSRIRCLLSEEEQDDLALLHTIFQGSQLSSRLHPLIFDDVAPEGPEPAQLRSMSYLQELVTDATAGGSMFASLSQHQKHIIGVAVRDLFLATDFISPIIYLQGARADRRRSADFVLPVCQLRFLVQQIWSHGCQFLRPQGHSVL
jgi:hypothetical protein